MSNCRHHWSLKGVRCPYCVDELIESKDRELATAKAENGRLIEAMKTSIGEWEDAGDDCEAPKCGHNHSCGPCKSIGIVWRRLEGVLSTSNALDYWQGEIREAERKGMRQASDILFALHKYDKAAHILILELNKSNQSKGEKPSQKGGIDWTPEKRKEYEKIVAEYREALRPLWEAAERSTKISGEDMNRIVRSDTNPQSKGENLEPGGGG